jgi:hypothetical protein
MAVPKQGTYKAFDPNNPEDLLFQFHIDEANPNIGDIRGQYWTKGSLMGTWESELGDYPGPDIQPERSSSYSWVARAEKGVRINQPPFLIRIVGTASKTLDHDGRAVFAKCQHSWTGVYDGNDVVQMMGTQCYFEFDPSTGSLIGEPVVTGLLQSNFKRTGD